MQMGRAQVLNFIRVAVVLPATAFFVYDVVGLKMPGARRTRGGELE